MDGQATPRSLVTSIDRVLAEFRRAWYAGRNPDVKTFCRDHAACGPELRARIENFLVVARALLDRDRGEESPSGR